VLQAESKYGDSVRPSGIYLMQRMLLKAMAND
jgi:hypothetical protein